ncbi:Arc family DNA-binding protein [Enterovirga sp. CN4-39]|uniref:Arc family DNA-binding protein n=1 Tax=Enterovirga sp. CN4-39 TaxID=3400910 RepID=UPI003BFD4BBE
MARPKLPEGEGKRHPLHVRTTKQMREDLEAAAAASGRSLAQEIETRLEQSFLVDQMLGEVAERIRATTIDLMAATVGGPVNLSVGFRVAQILSWYDLPKDEAAAIRSVTDLLPHIMQQKPLPFGASISEFDEAAIFDAAMNAPILGEIEGGKTTNTPTLPEGARMATLDELEDFRPMPGPADLFRSVIENAKGTAAKAKDSKDRQKRTTRKAKS